MRRAALVLLAVLAASCGDRRLTTIRAPGAAGSGGAGSGGAGTSGAGSGGAGTSGTPSGNCSPSNLFGYATVGGPTVGGQGGKTVRVTTPVELVENTTVAEPRIIEIVGMLDVPAQVPVSSDKTIVGIGRASGLNGGGFNVVDARNVILRNLVITKPLGKIDAIQIYNAENVWIDHCDLSSELDPPGGSETYDGLVDIVHGSNDVTVSWTRFHDHNHVSLIGHSNDNGTEDTGRLHVTFHHNFFLNTQTYNPSVRFGEVHVFNNYYLNVADRGIWSRLGARVLAEANTFENVPKSLNTDDTDGDGFITERGPNLFINSPAKTYTTGTDWTPPYPFKADPADEVFTSVEACAGTL